MKDLKIHCACGASWDIDENYDDIYDSEITPDGLIVYACYTCPKCKAEIVAAHYYTKKLVQVKNSKIS